MKRSVSGILGALLFASALPCMAFQDRLDVPAMKSDIASKRPLNSVVMAGARLVAVGQRGHILFSDDAGKSWKQAQVPVSTDLTAVCFPSSNKGWAVGHDGVVLMTSDAGATWVKQLDFRQAEKAVKDYYATASAAEFADDIGALERYRADSERIADAGADKSFLDVWFDDEANGYAVGVFNQIFHTSDGGMHWVPWMHRTENPNALHFYGVRRIGGVLFLVGEQGMVLRLDSAAQRFRRLPIDYKGTFFGIAGQGRTILAFGLRGTLFRSDDAGQHWKKMNTNVSVALVGAARNQDGRIAIVSQRGDLLVSSDGSTFDEKRPAGILSTNALTFLPSGGVMLVGAHGTRTESLKR